MQASSLRQLPPGTWVEGFTVEALSAEGAHAAVYRARHADGRVVALKVLRANWATDKVVLQRFALEREVLLAAAHPHVSALHAWGDLPSGQPWLALEWLDGETWRRALHRQGPYNAVALAKLFDGLAGGLRQVHRAGFVHRDLKPENVMLTSRGAVLLDFGVARPINSGVHDTGLTSTGHLIGSLPALSPEQIRGAPLTAAADIYACGVMLYELLTGRLPFRGVTLIDLEQQHLDAEVPAMQVVDPAVEAVVQRCLRKEPAHRFESVDALAAALNAAVDAARNTVRWLVTIRAERPTAFSAADTLLDFAHARMLELGAHCEWHGPVMVVVPPASSATPEAFAKELQARPEAKEPGLTVEVATTRG